LAVAGFCLVIHASYPGYLYEDTWNQLDGIFHGRIQDWNSAFVVLIWSGLLKFFPGPVGFIVLDNVLLWGALVLIAIGAVRRVGWPGLLVLALPFLPGLFNFLGHVHRDAMLAAWLLAAFACAFRGNRAESGRTRVVWQVLANVLAVGAFLIRENAVFSLIPLLLYANMRLVWRRNLLASVAVLIMMPLTQTAQNYVFDVERMHAGNSIKVFHLVALSYFEGRNLLPGEWTEEESRAIIESCYLPMQWDTAAYWGGCNFIDRGLHRQNVWNSAELTRVWLKELVTHPLEVYSTIAATFKLSMHDPNSRAMLYQPPKSDLVIWAVEPPLRESTEFAQNYTNSKFNDRYGRPWVFVAVSALAAMLLFALRLSTTRLGWFALAVLMSGTIYLLTYFPINVSAEYRYFYWSGFAAWLGLALTLLAWRERRMAESEVLPLPALVRLGACAATAAAVVLTFAPFNLPLEQRVVTVTPLEGGNAVAELVHATRPAWMGKYQGLVDTTGWRYTQKEDWWVADEPGSALTASLKILHQSIRLKLIVHPEGGKVRISDGVWTQEINTRSAEAKELVIEIPPPQTSKLETEARYASWLYPVRAILWTGVLTAVLFWLPGLGVKRWRQCKDFCVVQLNTRSTVAIYLAAILGFVLIVHASYPGYLHADNVFQLWQMKADRYNDWQPLFIIFLWRGLLHIFPGPVGFLVLDNLLIWGALAAVALGIRRQVGLWALLLFIVPFMPGMLNLIGHANRDVLLVVWMIAALACAFHANGADVSARKRLVLQILVVLFAICAFLVRTSAVFALAPLLLYSFSAHGWRRNVIACLAVMVVMPVVHVMLTQIMVSQYVNMSKTSPGDMVKTHHLLALSYFEGKNLFPGTWTEEESRQIVEDCYTPNQWEVAAIWRIPECGMIHANLINQGVWGSEAMTKAWLTALINNPVGAYSAMAATFRLSMREPNSPLILYPPERREGVEHWEVSPPFRLTTQVAQTYMQSRLNSFIGRPGIFGAILALSVGLLLVLRLTETRIGLFALVVATSGIIFLLTFFPFNVSAEYRYFYWSGFAAWLGLALTLLAWWARRRGDLGEVGDVPPLPAALRLVVCVLAAAALVLVRSPFRLPQEERVIVLTPLSGSISVAQLSTASIPLWKGVQFEGRMDTPDWHLVDNSLRADGPTVLNAFINTLHQTIRLRLRTGPEGGRVRVEEKTFPFSQEFDTWAAEPGELVVNLRPPQTGKLATGERHASWLYPARAILWTGVLTALLFWLSGRGDKRRRKDSGEVQGLRLTRPAQAGA
jgi:hypothetical protein